jgi:hypothetical protein
MFSSYTLTSCNVCRHNKMATINCFIYNNLSLQEGNLAENFKEWIQSFELYLTATGIEEKAEKVQVATFLHVAGPRWRL